MKSQGKCGLQRQVSNGSQRFAENGLHM